LWCWYFCAATAREYHLTVKLRPDDAAGNNGLGAVLVAAQDIPSKPFQPCNRGSRHVPIIEAHCNLGFALAGQEDFEGPAEQFRLASQLQPEDANVEANLEAARAQTGRYLEAKSHFERALQIEPNQPIAKENLEALQKEMNSHECNCLVPLPLFDLALFDLALSDNDLSFRAWRGTCCLLVPAYSRLLVASLPGMPRPFRFRSFMIRCS
jgi:tetratricopeptide (TPR) repeat protein